MVHELVERITHAVSALTEDFEIILVNDASPDASWVAIQQVCTTDPRVKGIDLSRNFGQHYAITAGLTYATGDWIVVMDCDLQDRPEEIPNLYRKAQEGYDIVYARRVQRNDRFWKRQSSTIFHAVFDYLSGTKTDKTIANFGIYKKIVIEHPTAFLTSLNVYRNNLSPETYNTICSNIKNIEANDDRLKRFVYTTFQRSRFNGYATQSLSTLKNVLLYFIQKYNGVFKTKMNKLLFYSDFLSYKQYGVGITGLEYIAIQHGPVPCRYDRVYSVFDEISTNTVSFSNGTEGEMLVSNMEADENSLTEEQKNILNQVYLSFMTDTSNSISDKSHEEEAWLKNYQNKSVIDYNYAFDLRQI